MSSYSNILILQSLPDELRLVDAAVKSDGVRLNDPVSFFTGVKGGDSPALSDPSVLEGLATHVAGKGWTGRDVFVLIGGGNVACQYLELPPLDGTALRQAAQLKIAQQIHFDISSAVVCVQRIEAIFGRQTPRRGDGDSSSKGASQKVAVQVVATHRDLALAAMSAAARSGLIVKGISASPAAFAVLATQCLTPREGIRAAMHIDERVSSLAVLVEGVPCVTTELPFGACDLSNALMRPIIAGDNVIQLDESRAIGLRSAIGIPDAKQVIDSLGITGDKLLPLLEPTLQKLVKQLTQWLTFAATSAGGRRVASLQIVGPGSTVLGLAGAIESRLGVSVSAGQWAGQRATFHGAESKIDLEAFALAVAATTSRAILPDLIPPEVRRERRVAKVRRWTTIGASSAAAILLALSVLFQQMEKGIEPWVERHRGDLMKAAEMLEQNRRWKAQTGRIDEINTQMREFSRANPAWAGVFKEMSLLLPSELKATLYEARIVNGQMSMSISANVYPVQDGRSFDEIVSQTLLLLQRSGFFTRVELVSANRGPQASDASAQGALNVALDLSYPRPRT